MNLVPLLVVWIVLALVVMALFVWRRMVASHEDDTLHVLQGSISEQTVVAQKLEVIDKWGKIATVITVIFGLLLAAAYVLAQFSGRSSLGA